MNNALNIFWMIDRGSRRNNNLFIEIIILIFTFKFEFILNIFGYIYNIYNKKLNNIYVEKYIIIYNLYNSVNIYFYFKIFKHIYDNFCTFSNIKLIINLIF